MRRTLAALAICLLVSHVAAVPVRDGAAPAEQATSSETWLSSWTGRAEKLVNSGIAIKDHLSTMVSSKSDASAEKPVGKKAPICEDLDWRKNSMRLLKELRAEALFKDTKEGQRFELSGVATLKDEMYMIFDSLDYIGKTDEMFEYRDPANVLIGTQGKEESGFEAIMASEDTNTFLIVREAVESVKKGVTTKDGKPDTGFFPSVVEVSVNGDDYTTEAECKFDYEYPSASKGIEGALYFSIDGQRYVLGLCEGNSCKDGATGKEPGNGMAVLTQLSKDDDGECIWKFVKELPLPKSAFFQDYADIALHKDGKTVAIVSQEEAAIWVGGLDTEKWEFVDTPGMIYHFPRSIDCEVMYCNIEGVTFLDGNRILTTSDAAKSSQSYNCVEKAQSVQVFSFPDGKWNPNTVKKEL